MGKDMDTKAERRGAKDVGPIAEAPERPDWESIAPATDQPPGAAHR